MIINYGGYLVRLPIDNATLRGDVRRTYRDWRKTSGRYDARVMAERSALWFAATSHPRVSFIRGAK